MNGDKHPRGCPGAVYSKGAPSYDYCMGGSDGQFPWWSKCCEWSRNKECVDPWAQPSDRNDTDNATVALVQQAPKPRAHGVGETLMWGNHETPESVVNGWCDESSDYDSYENGGKTKGSRGWERFVQVVWSGVTKVGCGYVTSCPTPAKPLQPNTWVCWWDVEPEGTAAARIVNVKRPTAKGTGVSASGPPYSSAVTADLHQQSNESNPTATPSQRHTCARAVRHFDRREALRKARRTAEGASRTAVKATDQAVLLPDRVSASPP